VHHVGTIEDDDLLGGDELGSDWGEGDTDDLDWGDEELGDEDEPDWSDDE
jgi:hypothetical protein